MTTYSSPDHHHQHRHHHDFAVHVNSAATAVHASSADSIQDEWVPVRNNQKRNGTDTAQTKATAWKVAPPDKKKMKDNLASNSFYLPKHIEKKLQKNIVGQKKDGNVDDAKKVDSTSTPSRSYLAIMGYHSPGQQGFVKPAAPTKKLLHDRRHYEQRAWKSTLSTPKMSCHVSIPSDKNPLSRSKEPPKEIVAEVRTLLDLPFDILARGILPFLGPRDLGSFGSCSSNTNQLSKVGSLWQALFQQNFARRKQSSSTHPVSRTEWQLAYQVASFNLDESMRCFHTKKTFLQDVLGLLVDFTVNPKTKVIDYIALSQDPLSHGAFQKDKIRSDVFGNKFTLFLPLYFSKEHFLRALPLIQKAIVKLCPEKKTAQFDPTMVIDVFPEIVNTFVVLLSDEGVAASRKSFDGVTRIHRLFLALAQEYPQIQQEAVKRVQRFIHKEETRSKDSCPSLGLILPLLMVLNQAEFSWSKVRSAYLHEAFDRAVLWSCKSFPQLEKTHDETGAVETKSQGEERVKLTRDAMTVPLRLTMFHVYFLNAFCQGTVSERARKYDTFFFQPTTQSKSDSEVSDDTFVIAEPSSPSTSSKAVTASGPSKTNAAAAHAPLSFEHFRDQTKYISSVNGWKQFFHFVGLKGPKTKDEMAKLLRHHVQTSRRKKYHRAGMDFSRVHASGTSRILVKGQQYSTQGNLQRVVFTNVWSFTGKRKFLDATCLLYRGKQRVRTVDYTNTYAENGAVQHSGDVMSDQSGTHTIHINLAELPVSITSCIFVISAYAGATLADIISPSISFRDADADDQSDPLCTYDLDSHDKISHLKSIFMCKLFRSTRESANGGWHVVAIGDSHRGSVSDYGPIYEAAVSYL
jgi:stress response protein SCP2